MGKTPVQTTKERGQRKKFISEREREEMMAFLKFIQRIEDILASKPREEAG